MQNTHIDAQLSRLHAALMDIASVMNRPQRDEVLIREAGIPLDRALFPLLVAIGRFGPIGVVDLADRAGRDHTTVSRQVARLDKLGLVARQPSAKDRRVRETVASPSGRAMIGKVDAARARIGRQTLGEWEPAELNELVRLMEKFAATISGQE